MAEASKRAAEEKENEKSDMFDFVYFAIPDTFGWPRGQIIPRRFVEEKMESGLQLVSACLVVEPKVTSVPDLPMFRSVKNGFWVPEPATLQATPWSDFKSFTTGMVLCRLAGEGVEDGLDTRQTVKRLLNRLWTEHGLILKSAYEIEFSVFKADDGTPLGTDDKHVLDLQRAQPDINLVLELQAQLQEAGIIAYAVTPESAVGQFEFNVEPLDGLAAADLVVHTKNAIKVFFRRRGYVAAFMAAPRLDGVNNNTLHLNHSLWTPDGRNVMRDDAKDNGISETALRWNAGILHHAAAMTALCKPTVNCYGRSMMLFSEHADWSVEDRHSFTRFKVAKGNVYLENRAGTGPASPYLLMAATLAAGMSGLRQEMTSPPLWTQRQRNFRRRLKKPCAL